MEQADHTHTTIRFGVFEVDHQSGELRKAGIRIRLQDQAFKVLLALVERPGEVVTREDLRRLLWPTESFGDFDHAVNVAVAKLRTALGDSADVPRYIETLHRRGYRFVGVVATNHDKEPAIPSARWKPRVGAITVAACVAGSVITFLMLPPVRAPKVIGMTRITRSGRVDPWRGMVSDGSRVFFLERAGDHWNVMQTSVEGGDSQVVSTPFRNTLPLDISPDRTEFLIASFITREGLMPLWIWPAQGGAPRRVGEVMAYDARWFGRQIIYAKNDGVYAVERDGSGSRLVAATQGRPSTFGWSPDGSRLRFTLDEDDFRTAAIWEMDANGNHLHRLFPGWGDPPHEESGVWLSGGRYYVFGKFLGASFDLWVTQERASFLHPPRPGPVRLAAGPEVFSHPLAATTGRRLLVFGANYKAELVRYNPRSRQFATLLASRDPWSAAYSRDGQWAAYVSPEGNLRKIRADGSEELSLTAPPLFADAPTWSPDGKWLAFGGRRRADQLWQLYVTSADGGTPLEIVPAEGEQGHPNWSSDGKLLAFNQKEKTTSGTRASMSIQVLNMDTKHVSMLANSQGKAFPSWSHDGHFVAALSDDKRKVMLFDLQTQNWSQVAVGNYVSGQMSWSADSKFLYFQDLLGRNEPVYRLRMDNRRIEPVASFEMFLEGGVPRCRFQELTTDGSLLVLLLRNHADIYALNLDIP